MTAWALLWNHTPSHICNSVLYFSVRPKTGGGALAQAKRQATKLAVRVEALQCLRTQGRTAIQRRSLAEAEAWIADRKGQGPFAFETICETLGINPDWLRESLRECRRQRLSGINTQRQIRHLPVGR